MAKTRTTVTIDESLLAEARSLPIKPLSNLFEESVRAAVQKAREQQWLEENREAIAEYNRRVTEEGILSDWYGVNNDDTV